MDRSPAATPATLSVEQGRSRRDLTRFFEVAEVLHADDPNWIAPLRFERLRHFDPRRNPFFAQAEFAYWTATRQGRPVGRISAQIDRRQLERRGDAIGHFGCLEAEDDPEVFNRLCGTAEDWLRQRGMTRVQGPFSLSINDECGLLVKGFDSPACFMMNYAPPYYADRLEQQGYRKAKDMVAYHYDVAAAAPPAARAFLDNAQRAKKLEFRDANLADVTRELQHIKEIFNDAWSDNWGFAPMTDADVTYLETNLKPLLTAESICFGVVDGEPVAMCVILPNMNEAFAGLGGRLLPFGWLKLLWRLKVRGLKSGRIAIMGVKRRFHGTSRGTALALGVIDRIRDHHRRRGLIWAELSWVLEDNLPARRIVEAWGGEAYKTYRIFEKQLS
ncbi:hypothetical protein [Algihabitans albus]|uniref:hypothetical protein n=1 Tax=Algihabitans albus TaxID=2164067 RepID=UPI000E5CE208|nr:hypothetical protein [Algihabitans albus]